MWPPLLIRNGSAIRKPDFGWPTALVDKALRNLASDGALARKEFHWPIPRTTQYYHPWLLKILEEIWDFDQPTLLLLGGPELERAI